MFLKFFLSLVILFSLNSIAGSCPQDNVQQRIGKTEVDYRVYAGKREIKLMSYNVQNLFDTEQDQGKMDWEFLPVNYPGKREACNSVSKHYREKCLRSDWTEQKYRMKLMKIKMAVDFSGPLPDLLALQEVENERVVADLAQVLGYRKWVITNSPDRRGIDVALLFNEDNLKYIDHHEAKMNGQPFSSKPTRNILGVNFQPIGSHNVFGVYVNHWPSQAAPAETRAAVAGQLKHFISLNRKRYGSNYHVIATGDFNTVDEDFPNPISHVIESPLWQDHLVDLQRMVNKNAVNLRVLMAPGTYFYRKTNAWNRFDRFLLSKNFFNSGGLFANVMNFRIIAPKPMGECFEDSMFANNYSFGNVVFGVPKRYDHNALDLEASGYSDHFPIVMTFSY